MRRSHPAEPRNATGGEASQVRRVVISNVYADDNRGGSAITAATIDAVRRAFPGCAISLITTTDSAADLSVTHRHTIRSFPDVELLPALVRVKDGPLGGLRAVLRSLTLLVRPTRGRRDPGLDRLRRADLVVGKGGQAFSVRKGFRGLAGLWLVLFPLVLARRLGVPTSVYSVTVGPYAPREPSGIVAGWVLRRMDLVVVRDSRSRSEALRLGVDGTSISQIPDCVFGLTPTSSDGPRLLERLGLERKRFATVTTTRASPGEDPPIFWYLREMIGPLLDQGIVDEILILLHSDGPLKSDRAASDGLLRYLDDPRVRLLPDDLSYQELVALYEESAFTIGGRIHSAILSLLAGIPAFPVLRERSFKAESIFEAIGLGSWVIRLDRPPSEWVALIQDELSDRGTSRDDLLRRVDALRQECRRVTTSALHALVQPERQEMSA